MNKQQLIAKYAKKFAGKSAGRPMLEGIHYGSDGLAVVTDGKYMIRIRNAHSFPAPMTIHASNGSPIDGVYPDTSRIFPTSSDNEIKLDRKSLEQVVIRARCAADVASRLEKKAPVLLLTAVNGETFMQIRNEKEQLDLSAFFGNTEKLDSSKRSLNAEYLHTALSVFADSDADQIVVKLLKGPVDPIVLTDEKDIDVLIRPYRVTN